MLTIVKSLEGELQVCVATMLAHFAQFTVWSFCILLALSGCLPVSKKTSQSSPDQESRAIMLGQGKKKSVMPVQVPTVPTTIDCDSFTDDDSFLSFVVLPKKMYQPHVTIIDAERPGSIRTTDRYLHHKIVYFSKHGNVNGAELRLTTDRYVPYLSDREYQTVERQTISPHNYYQTGSYREIFMVTSDRTALYSSLLSQPAELDPSLSNAKACAQGNFNACDHTAVAGQAWAWNVSGMDLFNAGNFKRWTSLMLHNSNGGYFFNMNKPTKLGMTQYFHQATTYAQMSYYPGYNAVNLANTAVWLSEGRSQIWPLKDVKPTLDMQNAFVVEHFTGCDAKSSLPFQDKCTVYEAHLYGQSSSNNICRKKMPLGLVGIFIGTTRKVNRVGIKIDQGIATYEVK